MLGRIAIDEAVGGLRKQKSRRHTIVNLRLEIEKIDGFVIWYGVAVVD